MKYSDLDKLKQIHNKVDSGDLTDFRVKIIKYSMHPIQYCF